MISNQNEPNEPCIVINPKQPHVLIVGANLNNYYRSLDTGQTWTSHTLVSSWGVWGDPVLVVDTSNNFYYFHLSNTPGGHWLDRMVCQKSSNSGGSWNTGTYTGLMGTDDHDKEWATVDRSNNHLYLTWTQFDDYGSTSGADSSTILFSKSIDGSATWSTPVRINKYAGNCADDDSTLQGAIPAVGPSGEIYIAWAGIDGIWMDRSTDGGNSWLDEDILVNNTPGTTYFTIPGLDRCYGFPVLKCDLTGGPNHGTLYLNWSDQRNGIDDTDIWLSKSTDGGDSWTSPVRVNDDPAGKHQFMSWMDIDLINGDLYFVYYDRRDYNDNRTDVYVAYSSDGGETFANAKISDTPFEPTTGIFFGDYNNIVTYNGIIRPVWTRLDTGTLSIWTDLTTLEDIITYTKEDVESQPEVSQYPNPSSDLAYVSFKLHESSKVSLSLYDMNGKLVKDILRNETKGYGKYIIPIQLSALGLNSGTYLCKLSVNEQEKTLRMIVVE